MMRWSWWQRSTALFDVATGRRGSAWRRRRPCGLLPAGEQLLAMAPSALTSRPRRRLLPPQDHHPRGGKAGGPHRRHEATTPWVVMHGLPECLALRGEFRRRAIAAQRDAQARAATTMRPMLSVDRPASGHAFASDHVRLGHLYIVHLEVAVVVPRMPILSS